MFVRLGCPQKPLSLLCYDRRLLRAFLMIKSNLINCRGPAQRAWAGPYRSRRRMLQLAGKEYMSDALTQGLERVRRRCITNLMSDSLGKAENRTWNAKQVVTLSFILPPTEGFLLPSLCDLTLSLSLCRSASEETEGIKSSTY